MAGVLVFQAGLAVLAGAFLLAFLPSTIVPLDRGSAVAVAVTGICLLLLGAVLPAPLRRLARRASILDDYVPAWQFDEVHARTMASPPDRVFDATRTTRPDEIRFFRALTWLRRGGRRQAPGILDAPPGEPILDTAVRGGFVLLAEDRPCEIVVGAVVVGQHRLTLPLTPAAFAAVDGPGFVKAVMSFRISPIGEGASRVTTETRVFATDPASTRRFAVYWRIIQPGSGVIRRMWLRAIQRRAAGGSDS